LHLKLYKKFQYYNFYDILISISQMYITNLASRELELDEILHEYNQINEEKVFNLDSVIERIDEISKDKNVQMCKKLDSSLI
jgi:hypothetical protein